MCKSLKCLDLSKVPFPQSTAAKHNNLSRANSAQSGASKDYVAETECLFSKALSRRLGGSTLELLNLAECGVTTKQLGDIVDGIIKSGLRRLGIASNNITAEGIDHVARFIRHGNCEGLDLGGNDLQDRLGTLAQSIDKGNHLSVLSLADCNVQKDQLAQLFQALAQLQSFKFIDLSQNHALFETEPSALSLLRRWLPKMQILKRIHLSDVSMTPEQAIVLAEILPDMPHIAHINILENPKLATLASAKDEESQEEACALFTSLMYVARVSKTLVCIDIEVPSNDTSEIVKALAKQVVAHCLFNLERGTVKEAHQAAAASLASTGGPKAVPVPDVLLNLVGHMEGSTENHDNFDPAPDEDYVIGGSGVVKALGICLRNQANDLRRPSHDHTLSDSGTTEMSRPATPRTQVNAGKAKDMSKSLLESARKIRARLQPALRKEERCGDYASTQRLQFLDQTLDNIIRRFETEFPETRLCNTQLDLLSSQQAETSREGSDPGRLSDNEAGVGDGAASEDEGVIRPNLSRRGSDVSIASRAQDQEEGRMHRFGMQFRSFLAAEGQEPDSQDTDNIAKSPASNEACEPSLPKQLVRAMLDEEGGQQFKEKIDRLGIDAVVAQLDDSNSELRRELKDHDPEFWVKFMEAHRFTMKNRAIHQSAGVVS